MPITASYSPFTLTIAGTTATDTITASRDAGGTLLVNGGAIPITGGTPTVANTSLIVASGNAGNDTITLDQTNGPLPAAQLFGGAGNDRLIGGSGADTLDGGDGNDFIDGNQGNDIAFLGAGNDTFQWDPGDGSDTVEGGAGTDTLLFNGSAVSEIFTISANGGRTLLNRNVGNIVMDLNDVETITVNALGGTDQITVTDLSGTDVKTVNVNLAGTIGGTAGDGQADTVTVNGTSGNNTLTLSLKNGKPVVNGLSYAVAVANAEAGDVIEVAGLAGNDVISIAGNGALPSVRLFGGSGNDTLTGGAAADQLFGDDDNDTLLGKGGDDQIFGGFGDDRMIWNDGDGTDLMEGGDGIDIAEVNGGNGAEVFTVTANGARVRFDRLSPNPFALDIGTTETLVLKAGGGNDSFSATGNLAALISITVDGGAGNDTLLGGNGADTLIGGTGNDFVDGNQGNDIAFLGAGNDVFQWDPGDGSDTVEGGAGIDTLLFNGSAGSEIFAISANGGRALFTRNVGNIVMDLNDLETITVNALGGTDQVTVTDLSGTDVKTVNVNLAGTIGGTAGDGQADTVTVNGTSGNNTLTLSLKNGKPVVNGLSYVVVVENAEAGDAIRIAGQGGNDVISAVGTGTLPTAILSGGTGNDVLTGSAAADQLFGDDDNDTLLGKGGDDLMFGGFGDDRMIWNDGDGNDLMEGGDGIDTAEVNGGNGAEVFTVTANGTRVRFDRLDPNPFLLDIGTTETLVLKAGGGNDTFSATGNLAALISITVDGGAGNDTLLGGNGVDTLLGGIGNDFIDGNQGNDIAFLGVGNDIFQWDPGDGSDTVEGQAGTDTLLFNGSAGNEIFEISANGGRALFTRDLSNIVMDLNDVETITVNALGGTDQLTVNDLSGTDVKTVNVNLAGTIGGTAGDGQADTVAVNGTSGANSITVGGSAGSLSITGLSARVAINQIDATDQLVLLAGDGNDRISAVSLANGIVSLRLDGGAGNDTITGSNGADVLLGGAGRDTLAGGAGNDAFVFNTALNAATNVDRITDYSVADDTMQLENAIFTALTIPGTLTAGQFLIGGAAQDADDYIIYNSVTGALMYDADGNGAGAATQFATLSAGLSLTNNDFFIF